MRVQDASLGWLVVLGSLAACAGGAERRPEPTQPASAEEPSEPVDSPSVTAPEPAAEGLPTARDLGAEPPPEPTPSLYTEVSFDLRSMPHRGPHDVDARLVSGRVALLMQRVRDAAGEPAPRLLVYPGASVFRAEFFGSESEALAQCQRSVAAVAAPATQRGARQPPGGVDGVEATPCAPIERQ